MTNIPYPPQRQLSVGEVLDLSFGIYRATVGKCLLFAGFAVITGQLANIYTLARGRPLLGVTTWQDLLLQARDPGLWAVYLVGTALTAVFYSAVLLRQRALIGNGAAGGEVAAATRRLPALIGLGLLFLASGLVLWVPLALTVVSGSAWAALLALAGALALCYWFVAASCAHTILMIDGFGPAASLSRSWRLTSGSFWRLSVIYTVAFIILIVLYLVTAAIAGFVAGALGRGDFAIATASAEVVGVALGAIAIPFYGALALAVLGDLKVRKEGADLERRISSATA
jgi:hypothetical protein